MSTKTIETKAVLVTAGPSQDFEPIKARGITKETFNEESYREKEESSVEGRPAKLLPYKKNTHTAGVYFLGTPSENDVIEIEGQDVYAIAFEDGTVYVVGSGPLDKNYKEEFFAKKENTAKEADTETKTKVEDNNLESKLPQTPAPEKHAKKPASKLPKTPKTPAHTDDLGSKVDKAKK